MIALSRRHTLLLTAAALVLPGTAFAQTDPAAQVVQGFYDALVAQMKKGGPARARFDTFRPAVQKAFDIPGMTAVAVGPTWASLSAGDQKALTDTFERMTVANYVKNFGSFGGEKFTVDPAPVPRGAEKLIRSKLVAGTDTIPFNYRMRQVNGDWKVFDIFLNGNISQMAQKRSDFASTLAAAGPQGLAKRLNALADQELS